MNTEKISFIDLVVSDVHALRSDCDVETFMETVEAVPYRRLYIAGDLVDGRGEIPKTHMPIIDHVSENRENVLVAEGNHDPKKEGLVHEIFGITAEKKYVFERNRKRFCIIHGHQFDRVGFIFDIKIIDRIFMTIIWLLKKIHIRDYGFRTWVDHFHKGFASKIDQRIAKYARRRKIDVIICGHTHVATHKIFNGKKGRKIEYFNCGDWLLGSPCSYVTIDQDGNTKLHFVIKRSHQLAS